MKLSDFKLLKKFMAMTMNDNDHEALAALKHANRILNANAVDWERVLNRSVQLEVEMMEAMTTEPDAAPTKANDIERLRINEAFAEIETSDPKGTWADFIDDIREQWEKKKWLSPGQREALFNGVDRLRGRT